MSFVRVSLCRNTTASTADIIHHRSEASVPKSKTHKATNQAHKGVAKNANAKATMRTENKSPITHLLKFIYIL
jgi:predicted amino acid racemase